MPLLLALDPDLDPMLLVLLALAVVVPVAYLAWRFVERPAPGSRRRRALPALGQLGQQIATARPPIAPPEPPRLDVDGEDMPPPPTRRRINRALRVSTRQTMTVVKT